MRATKAVGSEEWSAHVALVVARLDERQRRWVGALLAQGLGRGGTKQIAAWAALAPTTIWQGSIALQRQLADAPADGRVRRPGGGRPPLNKKMPPLRPPGQTWETRQPGAPRKDTRKTPEAVSARAKRLGRASAKTVGRLLKGMQSSLRTTVKRLAGKPPPPRDPQYRFLQRTKALFRRHGAPVLSIDAKQTERIGHCKNAGACWGIVPAAGNMYAFPSDAPGQATPYGLYDQVAHHA